MNQRVQQWFKMRGKEDGDDDGDQEDGDDGDQEDGEENDVHHNKII